MRVPKDPAMADAVALELAGQLAESHTGPHAPGTHVRDMDNRGDEAVIIGMSDTWATVVYLDEPDVPCACLNAPGRWVAVESPYENYMGERTSGS